MGEHSVPGPKASSVTSTGGRPVVPIKSFSQPVSSFELVPVFYPVMFEWSRVLLELKQKH